MIPGQEKLQDPWPEDYYPEGLEECVTKSFDLDRKTNTLTISFKSPVEFPDEVVEGAGFAENILQAIEERLALDWFELRRVIKRRAAEMAEDAKARKAGQV